jgi:hypothetical protein
LQNLINRPLEHTHGFPQGFLINAEGRGNLETLPGDPHRRKHEQPFLKAGDIDFYG